MPDTYPPRPASWDGTERRRQPPVTQPGGHRSDDPPVALSEREVRLARLARASAGARAVSYGFLGGVVGSLVVYFLRWAVG